MRPRRPAVLVLPFLVLALAALGVAACAGTRGASRATAAAARAPHPDVGAAAGDAEACASCHEGATPAVVQEWTAGAHGVNLVKCFVCHGSTGADFVAAPAAIRCEGCHPAAVASVTRASGEVLACFRCHAPHTLAADGRPNPHRS